MIPNIQFNSLKEEVTNFDSKWITLQFICCQLCIQKQETLLHTELKSIYVSRAFGDELFYFINLCLQRNLQKVYLKSQTTCQ